MKGLHEWRAARYTASKMNSIRFLNHIYLGPPGETDWCPPENPCNGDAVGGLVIVVGLFLGFAILSEIVNRPEKRITPRQEFTPLQSEDTKGDELSTALAHRPARKKLRQLRAWERDLGDATGDNAEGNTEGDWYQIRERLEK